MKNLIFIIPLLIIACADQSSVTIPGPGPKPVPPLQHSGGQPSPTSVLSANGYLLYEYNEGVEQKNSNGYKLIIYGENSL